MIKNDEGVFLHDIPAGFGMDYDEGMRLVREINPQVHRDVHPSIELSPEESAEVREYFSERDVSEAKGPTRYKELDLDNLPFKGTSHEEALASQARREAKYGPVPPFPQDT